MSEGTLATVHVGLDVHAASVRLAAVRADELLDERTLPYDHQAVERAVSRWPRARCCYEAGPTGYGLARYLRSRGIACDVVAPGLVPVRPGDRIKTDPRDARKLARLHAGGLLEAIAVPSEQLEALRDLVRAREDARLDRMRDRHRMSKFLLRHGLRMPNKSWGVTRRRWLGSLSFEHSHQQQAFLTYLHALDLIDRRIEQLERDLDHAAQARPVGRTGRAAALPARDRHADRARAGRRDRHRLEPLPDRRAVHELRRARPSASTPPARSRSQGPITKAGNGHVRRLLVEAAWHQRQRPRVGAALAARQRDQDPLVLERAWRAQQRLHRRWTRMAGRGKPHQKIVVATARELAGFVWAIATNQPLRNA